MRQLRDLQDSGEITPEYLTLFLGPEDHEFYDPEDCKHIRCTLFSINEFSRSFLEMVFNEATSAIHRATSCTLSSYFSHWVFRSFNEV